MSYLPLNAKSIAISVALLIALLIPWSLSLAATSIPNELLTQAAATGSVKVIVRLNTGFSPEGLNSANAINDQRQRINKAQQAILQNLSQSSTSFKKDQTRRYETVPYLALETNANELKTLAQDGNVQSITKDYLDKPNLDSSIPVIDADLAWAAGYSGSGQTVAVLDSGVMKTHSFLASKVVSEACYSTTSASGGSTSVCPGSVAQSTATGSGVNCNVNLEEGCSHGTHVAGITAGAGTSFSGVAKQANVIAVQVFSYFPATSSVCYGTGCIQSYVSDQMLALERIYNLRNAFKIAAVNMSLGGGQYTGNCDTDARKALIDNLRSVGIATVIAAGNSGYKNAMGAPGCISTAITVGSTNDDDTVASYSNVSATTDIFAPGSDIRSSVANDVNAYQFYNGTSMAAPHVAGAVAVLKSKAPNASIDVIENALKVSGVSVTDRRAGGVHTKPRLDLDNALAQLSGTAPVPAISAPTPSSTLTSTSQAFTWTTNGNTAIAGWKFLVGTTGAGSSNLANLTLAKTVTSATVNNLPNNGSKIYVRLSYQVGATWSNLDYTYTAVTVAAIPKLATPTPSSTLTGTSQTFTWSTNGNTAIAGWKFLVGTTGAGSSNLANLTLAKTVTSATVNNLPSNGSTVYVRLSYQVGSTWSNLDYTYTAFTATTTQPPFVELFDDGLPPTWTRNAGTWDITSSSFYHTTGNGDNAFATSTYNVSTYTNSRYLTKLWRGFESNKGTGVFIRSSGSLTADGLPQKAYLFEYTSAGYFSVWKYDSRNWVTLQNWAASSAIKRGANWNELQVYSLGNTLWFYINNTLLWKGTDSSFTVGQVGLTMYNPTSNPGGDLWVDWAVLKPLALSTTNKDTVSAAQQAINTKANQANGFERPSIFYSPAGTSSTINATNSIPIPSSSTLPPNL